MTWYMNVAAFVLLRYRLFAFFPGCAEHVAHSHFPFGGSVSPTQA